MRRHQITDEP